ncbi:MAG: hypothetical protein ISR76_02580 [Planctomycetes bacterium]|nr:hypothetical protein [Planctomycetota bacterium]MBL7007856.1 hypothetical protein [Planctomycetota bacterium]
MIIVLNLGSDDQAVQQVLDGLEEVGLRGRRLDGLDRPVVHVLNGPSWHAKELAKLDPVSALIPTSGPRHRREGRRFFPYHFLAWSVLLLLVLSGLIVLSGYFPPGLGRPANVLIEGEHTDALWFFRGIHGFLDLFPAGSGSFPMLLLTLIWLAFFLLPEIDRTSGRSWRRRLPVLLVGLFCLFGGFLLSLGGSQ